MSVNADQAYKYDKFYCRLCRCWYLVLFDKKREKVFFMCGDCNGCLDEPVAGARLQENTFAIESNSNEDYPDASLEQIRKAGLDLKHVFKRDQKGEAEYVE